MSPPRRRGLPVELHCALLDAHGQAVEDYRVVAEAIFNELDALKRKHPRLKRHAVCDVLTRAVTARYVTRHLTAAWAADVTTARGRLEQGMREVETIYRAAFPRTFAEVWRAFPLPRALAAVKAALPHDRLLARRPAPRARHRPSFSLFRAELVALGLSVTEAVHCSRSPARDGPPDPRISPRLFGYRIEPRAAPRTLPVWQTHRAPRPSPNRTPRRISVSVRSRCATRA